MCVERIYSHWVSIRAGTSILNEIHELEIRILPSCVTMTYTWTKGRGKCGGQCKRISAHGMVQGMTSEVFSTELKIARTQVLHN